MVGLNCVRGHQFCLLWDFRFVGMFRRRVLVQTRYELCSPRLHHDPAVDFGKFWGSGGIPYSFTGWGSYLVIFQCDAIGVAYKPAPALCLVME